MAHGSMLEGKCGQLVYIIRRIIAIICRFIFDTIFLKPDQRGNQRG
jgi:hypothetical protein